VGTLLSTVIVGGLCWLFTRSLELGLTPFHCLLFGALISPTDPIAVLAMLKSLGAPRHLEAQIAGESLFNDCVGVVVFLALLQFGGRPMLNTPTRARLPSYGRAVGAAVRPLRRQ